MPTILVVDDEPLVLRVVARILELAGYSVLAASGADEGLRLASLHPGHIDLLIVDHSTLRSDGKLERIGQQHPGMLMLRYSGQAERDLRQTGEMPPASSFLQKPFKPKQLLDLVRSAVGAPAPPLES